MDHGLKTDEFLVTCVQSGSVEGESNDSAVICCASVSMIAQE